MSVEAFAHQLYEPLVIPDDTEQRLRHILSDELHLQGRDLAIALQNPADAMSRLSLLLIERYHTQSEHQLQVTSNAKTCIVGSSFEDALRIQLNTGYHNMPRGIELSMATDGMNTMYQEGTLAHITIADDMAWINLIGFAGRHHGVTEYTEATVTEPHIINEIYLQALYRLTNAVETAKALPIVSDYLKRELGKSMLLSQKVA